MQTWTLEELERQAKKVAGHWLWTFPLGTWGYGQTRHDGKTWKVHKLYMFLKYGPSDLLDLHKCRYRNCFNPEHLYRGTDSDNANDSVKDGTKNFLRRSNVCSEGHKIEGSNVYWHHFPKRHKVYKRCRICRERDVKNSNKKASQRRG